VLSGLQNGRATSRDLRIDWLRGLAMICVIVNHSKLSSLLSWFSYERFWVVTAAEVFVVLSGIVLGMVYGRRLVSAGWRPVVRGLARRAALLYLTFVGVTLSVILLGSLGVDVSAVTSWEGHGPAWFLAPRALTIEAWRDVLSMRAGPWPFEIVGLYVWLVAAAVPCLLMLHRAGWRPLIAVSWGLYLGYRIAPHQLTVASFESVFPILAWQLLFVHGITIGYHRIDITNFASRAPRIARAAAALATASFGIFAFCNPWSDGPSWLHLAVVGPDRFADMYSRYFGLTVLGIGRLANLAIALPLAYAGVTRYWSLLRPLHSVFVTLGQRSLGAFVLHVYGLLLLAHTPFQRGVVINTVVQMMFVITIAALLDGARLTRARRQRPAAVHIEPLAA
jgi:hypothetical protein